MKAVLNSSKLLERLNNTLNTTDLSQVGPQWGNSLWIRYGLFFPIFLATLLGNFLVILVVVRIRKLHTPSNYLIASLAVTDFLTSCFLPHEFLSIGVGSVWPFSPFMCQIRYATVILCCVASSHHLLAIAIDRYLLVTNILYSQTRQPKKIFTIIAFVWCESIVISLSPVFGWHNPKFFDLIHSSSCFVVISQSLQVFVGFISFYIPFIIMIVIYWQIFLVRIIFKIDLILYNRIKFYFYQKLNFQE
jgi:5-hydroxytryptamine receptor 1